MAPWSGAVSATISAIANVSFLATIGDVRCRLFFGQRGLQHSTQAAELVQLKAVSNTLISRRADVCQVLMCKNNFIEKITGLLSVKNTMYTNVLTCKNGCDVHKV